MMYVYTAASTNEARTRKKHIVHDWVHAGMKI